MRVALRYTLTRREQREVSRAEQPPWTGRWLALGLGVVGGIWAVLTVLLQWNIPGGPPWTEAFPIGAFGAFWVTVSRTSRTWMSWSTPPSAGHLGSQERSLDQDGLHVRIADRRFDVPWRDIVRVEKTRSLYLLRDRQGGVHHFPRQHLSVEQHAEVEQLLRARAAHATLAPTVDSAKIASDAA